MSRNAQTKPLKNRGSIFLIPPELTNFRLHGERAIIVDWKSSPIDPEGVIAWYDRIKDVTGIKNVQNFDEVKKGYLILDRMRLDFLKNKYKITHAVLYKNMNSEFNEFPVVFENETFSVISLE